MPFYLQYILYKLFHKVICFKNKTFTDIVFSDVDIPYMQFDHCTFINCTFDRCKTNSLTMEHCVFTDCSISSCSMEYGQVNYCRFENTKISSSEFINTCVQNTELAGVQLLTSNLKSFQVWDCITYEVTASDTHFHELKAIGNNRQKYADSAELVMFNCTLAWCSSDNDLFDRMQLTGCYVDNMKVTRGNAKHVEVSCCSIVGTELNGCSFEYGNVQHTNLQNSTIFSTDASGVRFFGCTFNNSHLTTLGLKNAIADSVSIIASDVSGITTSQLVRVRSVILTRTTLHRCHLCNHKDSTNGIKLIECETIGCQVDTGFRECSSCCPTTGEYIAWKFAFFYDGDNRKVAIIKLRIPENAKRVNPLGTEKCRASMARVESIKDEFDRDVIKAFSWFNPKFEYVVGQTLVVKDYDDDCRTNCSSGIHHYMSRAVALFTGQNAIYYR